MGLLLTDLARPLVMGPHFVVGAISQPAVRLDNLCDETVAAARFGLARWLFIAAFFVLAALLARSVLVKTRGIWTARRLAAIVPGAAAGMTAFVWLLLPWIRA